MQPNTLPMHDPLSVFALALAPVQLLARAREVAVPGGILVLALLPVLPLAHGYPANRRQAQEWASPP